MQTANFTQMSQVNDVRTEPVQSQEGEEMPTPANFDAQSIELSIEKECPKCTEIIKRKAINCRFCGYDYTDEALETTAEVSPES